MEEKSFFQNKIASRIISVAAVLMVCLYPCLFQWFNNADEAPVQDLLPMLPIFLGIALVTWGIAYLVIRNFSNTSIFTAAAMFVFINIGMCSSMLKGHFGWLQDRYLLVAAVLVLLVLCIFLRKKPRFPGTELCLILLIALVSLSFMSFVRAAPTLYEIVAAERKDSRIDENTEFKTEARPNVYFFLMDEYGGYENLQKYFDYDNSPFLDRLAEAGFQNSKTSHNGESVYTWTLVPNLLNLDYVVEDELPHLVKREYVDDPVLFRIFRNNGYQINMINHRDFLGHSGCNVLSRPQISDSIGDHLFDNSLFGMIPRLRIWLKEQLGLSSNEYYTSELLQLTDLAEHCADYTGNQPTFTMVYIQCPHTPYVVDAEGNPRSTGTNNHVEQYYYLDQLKWMNSVLEETTANIMEKDPDSIIIFQSDHGSRFPAHVSGCDGYPELDQAAENPTMQNILNCVYNQGKPLNIDGLSGINTFRTLLNQEFGTELEMLPEPVGYIATTFDWR